MNEDDDDEAECMIPNFSVLWLCETPERGGGCFLSFLDIVLRCELGGGVPWELPPRFVFACLLNPRSLSEEAGSFDVTELELVTAGLCPYERSPSSSSSKIAGFSKTILSSMSSVIKTDLGGNIAAGVLLSASHIASGSLSPSSTPSPAIPASR